MSYVVEARGVKHGQDWVVVLKGSKVVGGASVPYVRWLGERVPTHQLDPVQQAMVDWSQRVLARAA